MSVALSDQSDISLNDFKAIVDHSAAMTLDPLTATRLNASFEHFSAGEPDQSIYGLTTGLGPMVSTDIPYDQLAEQQRQLVFSHAAGLGAPLPARLSRAILVARAKSLSGNRSAIRADLVQRLCDWTNAELAPVIPRHGGVGASGDLVQLAHLALGLIGHGNIWSGGEIKKAGKALQTAGIAPLDLQFRDGLALINGVSGMTGIGALTVIDARQLLSLATLFSCLMAEITGAGVEFVAPSLTEAKRHDGQHRIAARMRSILEQSQAAKRETTRPLQEHYSTRCTPQILGAIKTAIYAAEQTITDELNSISDNPIFDAENSSIHHGGNFHGEPIAMAMDSLKIAIVKMTMLMERQLNFLLHDEINKILPAFLNKGIPGIEFGLQGAQFTAVSTTAHSQSLAYPMSVHSIPSNKDNQDIVSMGTDAALMTAETVENGFSVASVLAVALSTAVDILELESHLSPSTKSSLTAIKAANASQSHVTYTPMSDELETVRQHLRFSEIGSI